MTKKYLLKDKTTQQEFAGMPERTPLVIAAQDYLSVKEELDAIKEILQDAKAKLVVEFRKAGKISILIEGSRVEYKHSEQDSVSVKKPKDQ